MFFILEIQGHVDGTFAQLIVQKPTIEEAEADYYRVLSAAATSGLPVHGATILDDHMKQRAGKCYNRVIQANE